MNDNSNDYFPIFSQAYISVKITITICNLKWIEIYYSISNFIYLYEMILLPEIKVRREKDQEEEEDKNEKKR